MRQFFHTYPMGTTYCFQGDYGIRQTVSGEFGNRQDKEDSDNREMVQAGPGCFPANLSWSHYLLLIRIRDPQARAFYEIEAAAGNWSVRELERQIGSLLFERLASAGDAEKPKQLARQGQTIESPRDILKDPLVLEFLDLGERPVWTEHDLECAIITRLQDFMLELGKGFSFVARQKRISIDSDHFYVDLVFYNRLLQAFVLVDLKLGKLTHQDLGQMQMYVHYFDRFEREEWERPTVGIVLCSAKNDAMVRITLPEDNRQIHAPTYQLYLPSEAQLRQKLIEERARFERNRPEPQPGA
jgi:predicted nuclease of restriction endonuclease-like (RecB) superfamily